LSSSNSLVLPPNWTDDEIQKLVDALAEGQELSADRVAEIFPTRSAEEVSETQRLLIQRATQIATTASGDAENGAIRRWHELCRNPSVEKFKALAQWSDEAVQFFSNFSTTVRDIRSKMKGIRRNHAKFAA
jgi:hypothetical protein